MISIMALCLDYCLYQLLIKCDQIPGQQCGFDTEAEAIRFVLGIENTIPAFLFS
jgi:hypothetical protein